jgi:hypothetical protein
VFGDRKGFYCALFFSSKSCLTRTSISAWDNFLTEAESCSALAGGSFLATDNLTLSPGLTSLSLSGKAATRPMTTTGFSGIGFPTTLAGVGPKKTQRQFPSGQKATSPTFTWLVRLSETGPTPSMLKNISSPHLATADSTGRILMIFCAVRELSSSATKSRFSSLNIISIRPLPHIIRKF